MDLPDSQSCAHQRDHNKAGNQNEPGRTFHEMWSGPCVGVVRSSGFKLEVTICALHYPCFLGPTILVDPTLLPGTVPPASISICVNRCLTPTRQLCGWLALPWSSWSPAAAAIWSSRR